MIFKPSLLLLVCSASAFMSRHTAPSDTRLFISSWTSEDKWGTQEVRNPKKNMQDYLSEPVAVEARETVEGTCLVSGLVNTKERTDQFGFDLLNHEDSAFEFSKIIAHVDDVKSAKKRLLSRSARYTGLLDKLDFSEAESAGATPTAAQLEGVSNWLAVLSDDWLSKCETIATTAAQVDSLKNVAILLQGATELDAAACQSAVDALEASGKTYTLVAVGKIEDRPEGQHAYAFEPFGTEEAVLPASTTFSREESLRLVTELLQLESGSNKALSFAEVYNQNRTEYRLVKGLREAGYVRMQEIDHMVQDGVKNYKTAVEEFLKENPDAEKGYTTDVWWEADIYKESRRRSKERDEKNKQKIVTDRESEIEEIAKEWAKREYFRLTMGGTLDSTSTSQEEFTKDNWERALFEGDVKYRQMKGEKVDVDDEFESFESRQEKKQKAMLARAKQELTDILEEDGLRTDDLQKKWEEEDDKENKD